jgi:hypothetical protein
MLLSHHVLLVGHYKGAKKIQLLERNNKESPMLLADECAL